MSTAATERHTPRTDDFGKLRGTVYMHSGATPRFFSFVLYLPQKELFLSIMSNYASESTFYVTKDVSTKILQETN